MDTQNDESRISRIFIHTFILKIGPLRVQGSHTFEIFDAHALRQEQGIPVMHAHILLTTFAQNCTVGSTA